MHYISVPSPALHPPPLPTLIPPFLPQVPALNIFETSYRRGKFDESRKLSNGKLMEFTHIYPMDAVFDTQADVPEDVSGGNLGFNHDVRRMFCVMLRYCCVMLRLSAFGRFHRCGQSWGTNKEQVM